MDELPPDNPDSEPVAEMSKADMLAVLSRLRTEHRAIDREIKAMIETGVTDMLKLTL